MISIYEQDLPIVYIGRWHRTEWLGPAFRLGGIFWRHYVLVPTLPASQAAAFSIYIRFGDDITS